MISLLKVAKEAVYKFGFKGIRCSTRPDKIDSEVLTILKNYGVTAIELGAQSMCDDVLLANNRGHDAESVRIASQLIKDFGFELGLQMMTGLYNSDIEKDIYTAKELIKLKPSTVRIYPTVTLENTYLAELYRENIYKPMDLDTTVELCSYLLTLFEENNIRVIRLGLHASDEITDKRVAGPYHPALREKCESFIIYKNLKKELENKEKGCYLYEVNPKLISKFIGQQKENINKLLNLGYSIKVKSSKDTENYKLTERIGEFNPYLN
ncbi:MAG: hypothetical protein E7564_08395 [Ruminococcaceae bacterium]|nr:hypothetical protein [Oscillospiraceae bacterium]